MKYDNRKQQQQKRVISNEDADGNDNSIWISNLIAWTNTNILNALMLHIVINILLCTFGKAYSILVSIHEAHIRTKVIYYDNYCLLVIGGAFPFYLLLCVCVCVVLCKKFIFARPSKYRYAYQGLISNFDTVLVVCLKHTRTQASYFHLYLFI
jgi:hypothetical protein